MWYSKKVTQSLGIEVPIIQAPMAGGATTPELVAAVSNAGGLGSLAAGYMPPQAMREAIRKIRQLTNKPFAVNLFIPQKHKATSLQMENACLAIQQACSELQISINPLPGPYDQSLAEQLTIVISEKVPVLSYTFGILDKSFRSALQENNTLLIGCATNLREALALEDEGSHYITAQGREAGGHRGTFMGNAEESLMPLERLIPLLSKQIKIPIIAAGGIMTGKDILVALQAGASLVQMGTAFLPCTESGIPSCYKESLLSQEKDNTVLTNVFSGKLARGINNQFIDRMTKSKALILDYPIQNSLTTAMRQKAKELNNPQFMSLWAGQSAHLCRKLSVASLLKTLLDEAVQ